MDPMYKCTICKQEKTHSVYYEPADKAPKILWPVCAKCDFNDKLPPRVEPMI